MRSGDAAVVRSADFDSWDRSQNMSRAIPVIGANLPVDFVKLTKIYFAAKVLSHRADIAVVLVGRDLITASSAPAKVLYKGVSVDSIARTDVMADKQLGFGVDGKPQHSTAPLCGIIVPEIRMPRVNKPPHLIKLHIPGADVLNLGVKQGLRLPRRCIHQGKDGLLRQTRKAGNSANAHAFEHEGNNLCEQFRTGRMRRPNICRSSRIGERCRAGSTAPTLYFAFAVRSELLAGLVLAFSAGHARSPLDFCGGTRHNRFSRSEAWVTPRFGLAPTPAETEAGAHYVRGYPLGWIHGYFHRWTVSSETDRDLDSHCVPPLYRAVPSTLRGLYLRQRSLSLSLRESRFLSKLVYWIVGSQRGRRRRVHSYNPCVRRLVSDSPVLRDLALTHQSIDDGVDRGHQVSVLTDVITQGFESAPHVRGGHRPSLRLERLPDGVGQSQRIFFNELFTKGVGEAGNHLANGRDLLFQFFLALQAFAHLSLQGRQLSLSPVERFSEIHPVHIGDLYTMSKLSVKEKEVLSKSSTSNWKEAIYFVDNEMKKFSKRIEKLKRARQTFQQMQDEGQPWPDKALRGASNGSQIEG